MADLAVTCETCGARLSCVGVNRQPKPPQNVKLTLKRRCTRPLVDGRRQCSFSYRAGVDI